LLCASRISTPPQGLGFGFSDRMGATASWWHCDHDHGMAIVRAPRSELSHYAFTVEDLNAMGRVADRLKLHRDARLIWGPSRHGPGNNQFMYFHDHDGAMIELCSDIAQMGDYQPRRWRGGLKPINQWGGPPPVRFILTGFPLVKPTAGRPPYAMRPDRTPTASART
jgi:Glyoxalase/Bleomycin resistance protein/Dioxygenase superfamily